MGPRPGTEISSSMPSGNSFFSSSRAPTAPVSAYSLILYDRSLPIPGIFNRSLSDALERSSGIESIFCAALRYARILNRFSPFTSSRSAISLNISAISPLNILWSQNFMLEGALGQGITSRILGIPVIYWTSLSKPRPNPACGAEPNFLRSRYQSR